MNKESRKKKLLYSEQTKMKLVTDIDAAQAKRIFDVIYEDTDIF